MLDCAPWLGGSSSSLRAETGGGSSAGSASRSQCEGREFDPPPLHHKKHTIKSEIDTRYPDRQQMLSGAVGSMDLPGFVKSYRRSRPRKPGISVVPSNRRVR